LLGAAPTPEPPPDDQPPTDIEGLFDRYADRLHRYVYHYVKSWETAQDLVQDLFLRLWDRRVELGSVKDLKSYLYTSARNRALAHLRHQRYENEFHDRVTGPTLVDANAAPGDDPAVQLDSAEIAAAVQRAVDALPSRQREALLLQWSGHSYAQIAAALSISPKTVAIHLGRAIRQLRRTLASLR
jgi:RNA polymerase sigma-70 factor (ECF subfamily)